MSQFVDINWAGNSSDGKVRIEYQLLGSADASKPLIVFLHEGLGSVAMWKEFPQQLCAATDCRGLVYSRPGYGKSTPRDKSEAWQPDFMHQQAFDVLPALFKALNVDTSANPPILYGHSDGGSIALLFAAKYPMNTLATIVAAPHIFVEDVSINSIEAARIDFLSTSKKTADLRSKLARYHDDVDSAFWGWNDIWLNPAFRHWNLTQAIKTITCPLLAVQGLNDEYGTLEQIRGIKRLLPHTQLLEIPNCRHSPHRDQPEALMTACQSFLKSLYLRSFISPQP
jgi:pimeloyl-ACP methyl ester carboxylesterase